MFTIRTFSDDDGELYIRTLGAGAFGKFSTLHRAKVAAAAFQAERQTV